VNEPAAAVGGAGRERAVARAHQDADAGRMSAQEVFEDGILSRPEKKDEKSSPHSQGLLH